MRPNNFIKTVILTSMMLVCFAASTNADIIPLGESGWNVVHDGSAEIAVTVHSFDYDFVYISIAKTFTEGPDEFGIFRPIVIEFEKATIYASAVIVIEYEEITNNTGVEWDDYHMFLMIDADNPEAGFGKGYVPNGDQLEGVSFDRNGEGFWSDPIQLDFVNETGGGVADGEIFRPGFASGSITIETDVTFGMEIGDRFGLKQLPTVAPEPATVLLLCLGALPVLRKKNSFKGGVK